jgi:hypothetical protein
MPRLTSSAVRSVSIVSSASSIARSSTKSLNVFHRDLSLERFLLKTKEFFPPEVVLWPLTITFLRPFTLNLDPLSSSESWLPNKEESSELS